MKYLKRFKEAYTEVEELLNDNLDLDQFGTFSCMYMTIEGK